VTEMHGSGTFFDQRLSDRTSIPCPREAAREHARHPGSRHGQASALHAYQLALKAPSLPEVSTRLPQSGQEVFDGQVRDLPRSAAV